MAKTIIRKANSTRGEYGENQCDGMWDWLL